MGNPSEDDYRRLYTENFTAVLNYARRRVQRSDDAADVVAETFLVAWRRYDEIPPGDDARLWLYGVARLVLSNHVRSEQRRLRLGERLRTKLRQYPVTADPAQEVLAVQSVRDALAGLDPRDREVLELAVWEELQPREIAVALGLSPDVTRARLSRARKRMLDRLGHESRAAGQELIVRTVAAPKEGRA